MGGRAQCRMVSDGGESIIKSRLQTLARYGHDTLTDTEIGLVVLV